MSPIANAKQRVSALFIGTGLFALVVTALLGCLAAMQFCFPEWSNLFPFHKTRPIHVALAMCWIFFTALGTIYYFINEKSFSPSLAFTHYFLFAASGVSIIGCYALGIFGGKEYLEYPPVISIAVFAGWLLYAVNFFRVLSSPFNKLPVYFWMWSTSVLVFVCAFIEAHLWILPYFGANVVRDMTVQWKSMGSLVASWNLMIYGIATCVMYQISKCEDALYSKKVFALFFIGITNSFFNWGHHTYVVPAQPWIQTVAYIVSMTELIILYVVIASCLKQMSEKSIDEHRDAYRFLKASDLWIVPNLILAILISVPALNVFAHGTHIIVAHSMGSILGINTMILFAGIYYIASQRHGELLLKYRSLTSSGFYLVNFSLIVFWIALLGAGYARAKLTSEGQVLNFTAIQDAVQPYMFFLVLPGMAIFVGLVMLSVPAFASLSRTVRGATG